jgi:hypothetical protein
MNSIISKPYNFYQLEIDKNTNSLYNIDTHHQMLIS